MEFYAGIKFLDAVCSIKTIKYYYFPVSSVYFDKNDNNHIKPNDLSDFENTHKYYVLWEDNIRYPGYIVCLGESLEDAENRATTKQKRIIIPKRLTSSDDELNADADSQNFSQNPAGIKMCKRQSQIENSQRILGTYKSQLLMSSRSELVLDTTSNVNDKPKDIIKNCTVRLSDCIKVSSNVTKEINTRSTSTLEEQQTPESCNNLMLKEQSILSNTQNDLSNLARKDRFTGKARKTLPKPAATTSQKAFSSPRNSENQNLSPTFSTSTRSSKSPTNDSDRPSASLSFLERQRYLDRFARLRYINTSDDDDPPQSQTPTSRVKDRFARLGRPRTKLPFGNITNISIRSRSPINSLSKKDNPANQSNAQQSENNHDLTTNLSPHDEQQNKSRISDLLGENETTIPDTDQLNGSGELNASSRVADEVDDCKHLYIYKRKLYNMYKRKKIDMKQYAEEHFKRYENVDEDKIYLGENITAGEASWRISKSKKYTTFLRDLGSYLWNKEVLPHRCLDLGKAKKSMPRGHELKLCSPRKLNLYLSLYEDYLKDNKRYKNKTQDDHDIMIKNSTESITTLIRDERKIYLDNLDQQ